MQIPPYTMHGQPFPPTLPPYSMHRPPLPPYTGHRPPYPMHRPPFNMHNQRQYAPWLPPPQPHFYNRFRQ